MEYIGNRSVILSGNKGEGLANHFSNFPHFLFCDSKEGYDLSNEEGRDQFCQMSLAHEVAIFTQPIEESHHLLTLKKIWGLWRENRRRGHIFIVSYKKSPKLAEEINRLHKLNAQGESHIKLTHFNVGLLDTPSFRAKYPDEQLLNCSHILTLVDKILGLDDYTNISALEIDPIKYVSSMRDWEL